MSTGLASVCATCHEPLVQRGIEAVCVRCLAGFLAGADDGAPDAGEWTAAKRHRYGHFELLTGADGQPLELGRGAMGTAYRARDTVLNRVVALKVIDRGVAEHPAARERFLREARAAARFHHPNVASVLHYGEEEGECFYVMELVEGETLAERVRRDGPLPVETALEIAVQIARGLAAAEAQGIVHRDLKPGNVMLEAAGKAGSGPSLPTVKVIDFGLAKAVTALGSDGPEDTRGGFVGTPAFASPEQFARGEAGRIDTRSDIYSLGVTLWTLLCGKLPFLGQTLAEIHAQQTRQPLPWDQLRAARVPRAVTSLLRSMLSAAAAARPQSARELLAALERCRRALPPPPETRRRRRFLLLGVSLALATLAGGWLYRVTRPPPPPPDRSIAVLPFENLSPDPANAFFTTGVQDQITADLAKVASLQVVESAGAKPYPAGKDRDLAAIGKELGVRHLLTGSLERQDDRVHVAVSMTDLQDLARPWNRQYDLRLSEVFAVQGEITRAVADRLQASLSREERAIINRPPTTSLQAYDLYLRGRQTSPEVLDNDLLARQDALQKIELLEQAVKLDPNFVLAYCALATKHDTICLNRAGSSVAELAVDHRALAEKYLDMARHLQPDAGEVHIAAAYHYYNTNRDFTLALEELEAARRTLPNNAWLECKTGDIARRRGRWTDAIRSYQRAAELDPHDTAALIHLLYVDHALRRYDDVGRVAAQINARNPGNDFAGTRARIAFESRADPGPWKDYFIHHQPDDVPNEEEPMIVATYSGDPDEMDRTLAASKLEEFMIDEVPYPRAWYTALAACVRGDATAARAAFVLARPTIENEVRIDPIANRPLSTLAIIDAALGRKEDAVREAQRACDLAPFDGSALDAPIARCDLAVVYAWIGDIDRAFDELNKVVQLPYAGTGWPDRPSYGDLRCNPLWKPLRADPRFDLLVRRLAPTPAP